MSDNQVTDAKVQRKQTVRGDNQVTDASVRAVAPVAAVEMVVLKKGAGRISKGVHVPGEGDEYYEVGEPFMAPADAVDALEDRGFAQTT